ncbi:MAG: hypothetical protein IKO68_03265 [Oscillospiraceae bacterium]|nr:hypothetical protein [Oscillospiraceae bacterium]
MKRNLIKTILCLLLTVLMIAALSACGDSGTETNTHDAPQTEAQTELRTDSQAEPERLMTILDPDGGRLGGIDGRAACTAADAGILYSVFAPSEYQPTATAEYRFFRTADRKDLLLGRLEDQGYEAVYARTELDGVVYTLAVTGNPMDKTPDPLWLLALDPAGETMTKYQVSEDGFPYDAMASVGGKLLILNHETLAARCDKLLEFDPASGALRELLSFPDDGTVSLRGVCAATDGFCLLRLRLKNGNPAELLLDRYDNEGRKRSERSLNETLIPAAKSVSGLVNEADILNEFGMMVSGFSVQEDRYLYYENFGTLRAVLDLDRGEALLSKDDLWCLSRGSGSPAVYRLDFDGDRESPEILALRDGEWAEVSFELKDEHRMLRVLSHSPGGTWLLQLSDSVNAYDGSEVLYLRQEP